MDMNKTTKTLPEGPTMNGSYNQLLLDWKAQGFAGNPECEDCACDLTGKNVEDHGTGWFCDDCMEEHDARAVTFDDDDRAVRRAESGYAQ